VPVAARTLNLICMNSSYCELTRRADH